MVIMRLVEESLQESAKPAAQRCQGADVRVDVMRDVGWSKYIYYLSQIT